MGSQVGKERGSCLPPASRRPSNQEKRGPRLFLRGNELPCTTSAVSPVRFLRVSSARGPRSCSNYSERSAISAARTTSADIVPGSKIGRACNARCTTRRSRRVHNVNEMTEDAEVEREREREKDWKRESEKLCTRCSTFTAFRFDLWRKIETSRGSV